MPRPARNVTTAITTAITAETPFAPRIASAGAAPPPAAMPGANTCQYLKVTGTNGTRGGVNSVAAVDWSLRGAAEASVEHVETRVEHVLRNVEGRDVAHRR